MNKLVKIAESSDAGERAHHAFRYGFFHKLSQAGLSGPQQAWAFEVGGRAAANFFNEKKAMAGLALRAAKGLGKGLQWAGTKAFGLGKAPGGFMQRQGDRLARAGLGLESASTAGGAAKALGNSAWGGTKALGRAGWRTATNPYFAAGALATPVAGAAGRAVFGGGEPKVPQPGQGGVQFSPEQLQLISQMFGGANPGQMMAYGLQGY